MSIEPQTWVVGSTDDSGIATQCLLALEDRFALPASVSIDHGDPRRRCTKAQGPARVLAFVTAARCDRERAVDLLRDQEAQAALAVAEAAKDGAMEVVAVALDRTDPKAAIDQAVKLAVTTLIDWGHEVACRQQPAAMRNA